MTRVIAFSFFVAAFPTLAIGEAFSNGNDHADNCLAQTPLVIGYVTGAIDTYFIGGTTGSPYMRICVPAAVTAGQATDVYCKYLADHPEERHYSAASLVWTALNYAWPCSDPEP
jgi:hypothetical protein